MKYGIISDIHGNLPAYEAVMQNLSDLHVNKILCLGDIVGYGASPREILQDILSRENFIAIGGNHDRQVLGDEDPHMRRTAVMALRWTRDQLPIHLAKRLIELPQGLLVDDALLMVHGSLVERDAYILSSVEVQRNMAAMHTQFPDIRICLFGHTHIPMLIGRQSIISDLKRTRSFQLNPKDTYLINPGAVGQPRDRCPLASFAVLDLERYIITYYRIPYDVERAQELIRLNGLPDRFASRLSTGI